MHAVDTNVVVRLFVRDDAAQTAAARQAVEAQSIFVPKTVMIELEWVLRSSYAQPRMAIVSVMETILATANVEVEDATSVARAVDWFRHGMDFADALHLVSSSHAERFLTFDTAMRRRASMLATRPPVVAPSA